MVVHLKNELANLKNKLIQLSVKVENALNEAIYSLDKKDRDLALKVIREDEEIDSFEVEVEEECLKIMALHQPVAIDLRFLVATLKITSDLERIGDLAVNIAERARYLAEYTEKIDFTFDYKTMSEKTKIMLKLALDSFVKLDSNLARKVCCMDNEVDDLNSKAYKKVYDEVKSHPTQVEHLMHYLFISRHLERIGDYATNISEDIIYMVDGEITRHKPEEFGKGPR